MPAWPARFAVNRRLITDTAWVEVIPTGLSSTTQPCTSCFTRFGFGPAGGCNGPPAGGDNWPAGAAGGRARRIGHGGGHLVSLDSVVGAAVRPLEVALYLRRTQEALDAFRFAKPLVDPEADVGGEFQIHAMRDLAAQKALVALERREHVVLVGAAERHHVDGGEPQVRRHAHLRHGDEMGLDHRIVDAAAREDVRHRMADEFADPQLTL